ncbi:MAG: hypothetical protein JSW26_15910 [Desulfobacterales bacterium]|nr:MAG: hypothetical protein JSW26_15910 [Desulfobacterales bacterium]
MKVKGKRTEAYGKEIKKLGGKKAWKLEGWEAGKLEGERAKVKGQKEQG